jgi:outer membrane immunogenic protein
MRSARLSLAIFALAAVTFAGKAQSAFGGFYVGATAGYSLGSLTTGEHVSDSAGDYFASSSLTAINAAGGHSSSPGSVMGGFTAGYNLVAKQWVLGFEVDYSALSLSSSHSTTQTYPCCDADFTIDQSVKATSLGTVRLRLGYAMPQWLFYGAGGVTFGTVKYTEHFTDTYLSADETASQSSAQTGWTLGAGAEYLLGAQSKWSVRFEYLYASLGTMTGTSNNMSSSDGEDGTVSYPNVIFTHSAGVSMNVIRAGIDYHFR